MPLELSDSHGEMVLIVTDDPVCAAALGTLHEYNPRILVAMHGSSSLDAYRDQALDRIILVMVHSAVDSCASSVRSRLLLACNDPVYFVSPTGTHKKRAFFKMM